MVSIEDDAKFKSLAQHFSMASAEGFDPCAEWVPVGTIEKTKPDGSIEWWDPITKRAMVFHNISYRHAWIIIQRDKGIFKAN